MDKRDRTLLDRFLYSGCDIDQANRRLEIIRLLEGNLNIVERYKLEEEERLIVKSVETKNQNEGKSNPLATKGGSIGPRR